MRYSVSRACSLPFEGKLIRNVSAIVVTFHPDSEVAGNLDSLTAQAYEVIVVDNGSTEAELALLRAAASRLGLELIENGSNLGIATGLNIGIRRVLARTPASEERWIMLFDQDSRITEGFVETMVRHFEASPAHDRLALLAPAYRDKRHDKDIAPDASRAGGLEVAMTSGSLLRAETFERFGLFVDELFIDAVDHEYSLRLRKAGGRIEECSAAVLLHSPGSPTFYRFAGWQFQTANYAPVRRYYQERNKLWIYRRYFSGFPRYCLRLFIVSVKDFAKIVLLESDKSLKIRYFLRGVLDGIRGRMGAMGV
jgi:rhamnosyltransferase